MPLKGEKCKPRLVPSYRSYTLQVTAAPKNVKDRVVQVYVLCRDENTCPHRLTSIIVDRFAQNPRSPRNVSPEVFLGTPRDICVDICRHPCSQPWDDMPVPTFDPLPPCKNNQPYIIPQSSWTAKWDTITVQKTFGRTLGTLAYTVSSWLLHTERWRWVFLTIRPLDACCCFRLFGQRLNLLPWIQECLLLYVSRRGQKRVSRMCLILTGTNFW